VLVCIGVVGIYMLVCYVMLLEFNPKFESSSSPRHAKQELRMLAVMDNALQFI